MGPGEGVGSWGRQGDEADGLQWPPWAELLCLGSFNRLLRSSGLRPGVGQPWKESRGSNWNLGSSDHFTQVPSSLWPLHPPAGSLSLLPSALPGASPSQAGCVAGSGMSRGLL